MEALSAFVAEALARLDCAPAFRLSLTIAAAESVGSTSFAEAIGLGVAIATSEVAKSA